jgi:hypothetical protein
VALPCPVCTREDAKKQCCICMIQETRMIFQPCNHIVCCETCAVQPHIKDCPVCRTPIQNRMLVYGDRFN